MEKHEKTKIPSDNNLEANGINPEKVFEVEVSIVRDEIGRRLDFERRLQNSQITFLGIIIGGYLSGGSSSFFQLSCVVEKAGAIFPFDCTRSEILFAAIIAVNTVFILEMFQNFVHINLSSIYVIKVLNKKYKIQNNDFYPLGWELFLNSVRGSGERVFKKFSFLRYPGVLTSLYLFLFPLSAYMYNTFHYRHRFSYAIFATIILFSGLSLYGMSAYVTERFTKVNPDLNVLRNVPNKLSNAGIVP